MKRTLSLALLLISTLLCVGCGSTYTVYNFPKSVSTQKKDQIAEAVDFTAHTLKLKMHSENEFGYQDYNSKYHRCYFRGLLSSELFPFELITDLRKGDVSVSLENSGQSKSKNQKKVEEMLTPALRHIDPAVEIRTGHTSFKDNPLI